MEIQTAATTTTARFSPVKMRQQQQKISPGLMMKKRELRDTMKKFHRACQQLKLLNRKCVEMKTRFDRAERDHMSCFRHNLTRKMAATQSVRQMFYEYVYLKSEEITALRFEIKHWVDDVEEEEDDDEEETEE